MAWAALGLTVETALFTGAAFIWLRSREYTFAEAAAGAVILVLMGFSLIHQLSFFLGSKVFGYLFESIALGAVVVTGVRYLPRLSLDLSAAKGMLRQHLLAGVTLLAVWAAMIGIMVAEWFSPDDISMVASSTGALNGLLSGGAWKMPATGPIPVLNAPALFFHTSRFGLGTGACGFGILCHMAIGFSTYALARRYAWPPMALTVSLMVLSMPRLVFLGLRPSQELLTSTAIVFALVLIYRLIEQHRPADLRILFLCLFFSIDSNPMSIGLVPVMTILLLVVMIRRHGWLLWRELMQSRPLVTALALPPALVLAQVPVFAVNLIHGRPLLGAPVPWDNDGPLDALANLVRYLFVMVDPTEPIRRLVDWMVGVDLGRLMTGIYSSLVIPVFSRIGIQAPFHPVLSGDGSMAFGPFAVLLVVPAMIHAMWRGPRRLKALTVAWIGYLYLASLVVTWQPGNIASLSPLFAANGFLVAFWLPPWRLRRRGMRLLQADFALLMAWSLAAGWHLTG